MIFFLELLDDSKKGVFGKAVNAIDINRQVKLRRLEELPNEEDVAQVRDYTVKETASYYAEGEFQF